MARLHSDLGQRTVYLENGLAKAQEKPCVVYKDAAGTQPANLAAYNPGTPGTPGAAIPGAVLEVDEYSNRPAFWDLDDRSVLYVSVDEGPVVPILPDAQPQIDAAVAGATAQVAAAVAASVPRAYGKNMFDPDTATDGQFWNQGTTTIPLAGWAASIKYPLVNGQTYTINNCRNYQLWNAAGTASAFYVNNTFETPVTFTGSSEYGWVSFNVAIDKKHLLQFEVGATPTEYEPYGLTLGKQLVDGRQLDKRLDLTDMLVRLPGVVAFRDGNSLLLRSPFDATRDILTPVNLASGVAGMVQLLNPQLSGVSLIPAGTTDERVWPGAPAGATRIHDTTDDNCPINVAWTYIGANHGWQAATRITLIGHGRTTADVGSQWSDGTRTYTLLKILNSDQLQFGGPYTVASGIVTGVQTAPAATLTHVSGATNTANIPITGGVLGLQQIYPSVYGQEVTVEIDGKPLPDGKTPGSVVTVTESYVVASYKGLIDTARANVGTPVANIMSQVPALARVSNTYRFSAGGQVVVAQKVTVVEKTLLSMGVTHALALEVPAGGSRRQFMAGIGTAGGLNFSTLADIGSGGAIDITPAAYLNPTAPANSMRQWAYDSGGVAQYGLAMGILPVGDGHPHQRVKYTAGKSWFIAATTRKNYPQLCWTRTVDPGQTVAGTAYRRYLVPPDTATEFTVSDGTDTWAIIERTTATSEGRMPAPGLLGRRLDPTGVPTITAGSRVTGEGVSYVSPAVGYGVWRAAAEPPRPGHLPGVTSVPGNWFVLLQSVTQPRTLSGSFQILYLFPQFLDEPAFVDRAAVEVAVLGTGVLRHGVYAHDPSNGQPVLSGPIADFGTVDITSTGVKESALASPVWLPSIHWYGLVWQGDGTTAPQMRMNADGAGFFGPMNLGATSALMNAGRFGYSNAGVTGALGALPTPGVHQVPVPRVAYRRA